MSKNILYLALLVSSLGLAQTIPISGLTSVTSIAGPELIPCVQSGVTDKCTPAQIATYIASLGTTGTFFTGTAPVVSACGTGPAIDSHATNYSGTVTVGTIAAASCTVTFASSGFVTWNHCNVTPETALATFSYSYTKTALVVTATSLINEVFDYRCDGS